MPVRNDKIGKLTVVKGCEWRDWLALPDALLLVEKASSGGCIPYCSVSVLRWSQTLSFPQAVNRSGRKQLPGSSTFPDLI